MKKTVTVLCILFCSISVLFAFDGGGTLSDTVDFYSTTPVTVEFSNSFVFTTWIRQPLGKVGSLTAEGNYKNAGKKSTLDVTLLKATMNFGPVKLEAGRFGFADASGIIYNMTADGANISFGSRFLAASLYGAYTGLMNSNSVSFTELQGTYVAGTSPYEIQATPKYITGIARLASPSLFFGQSLTLDGLALVSPDKKEQNRYYGTFAMNGPIVRKLYYTLSGSLSYINKPGFMGKGSIVWYPGILSASLSMAATYAGKNFSTVVAGGPSLNGALGWKHVVDAQVGISAKLASVTVLSITGDLIAAENEIDSKMTMHSFQYKIASIIQSVSDLSISVSVGQVIPINKKSSSVSPYLTGSVGVALAF